jgi:hypothetical protein
MKEIKAVTGKGLTYLSKEEWLRVLSNHFRIIHAEENLLPLHLNSPSDVLYHLKQTGVNAIDHPIWTPSRMKRFEETYRDRFSTGNQVQLTYHPLYFIVEKL